MKHCTSPVIKSWDRDHPPPQLFMTRDLKAYRQGPGCMLSQQIRVGTAPTWTIRFLPPPLFSGNIFSPFSRNCAQVQNGPLPKYFWSYIMHFKSFKFVLVLKLKTIHKCLFPGPINGRSQCYATLHSEEYGHLRTSHMRNKTFYINADRSRVEMF